MKGKWIWVIIGILVIVLLFLFFRNRAKGVTTTGADPGMKQFDPYNGGASSGIADFMNTMQDVTQTPEKEKCGSNCRKLCKIYPARILCKDRCHCKDACKSDCIKGLDYKSIYPMVPDY